MDRMPLAAATRAAVCNGRGPSPTCRGHANACGSPGHGSGRGGLYQPSQGRGKRSVLLRGSAWRDAASKEIEQS